MISSDKFRILVLHLLRGAKGNRMMKTEVMKRASDGMRLNRVQQVLLMRSMARCGWVLTRGKEEVYLTMEGRKAYKLLLRLYAPHRGDA